MASSDMLCRSLRSEEFDSLYVGSESFAIAACADDVRESLDFLCDGYYTAEDMEELAELVARERRFQEEVEQSDNPVRKWIQ